MGTHGISVEGHLVALSHTFKICNDVLFLMEILSADEVKHILVRRKSQLTWHQQLDIPSKYMVTHLKPDILYKGKHNIPIFHATRKSELIFVETDEVSRLHNMCDDQSLISYKGTVTSVLDEDIGIYQLDGRTQLVISYIHDITGEIWNMSEDLKDVELFSSRASGKERYRFLKAGDKVMIFHAHFTKMDGTPTLSCCGRSLVMKERQSLVSPVGNRSPNATLDMLHYYNFGIRGLKWLAEVRDHLVSVLCPGIVERKHILRRKHNGERSVLTQLLRLVADRQLISANSRSLTLEFLSLTHQCVLNKDFEAPFTLLSVLDLESSANMDECDNEEKQKIWSYNIDHHDPSRAVIGMLQLGQNGVLQLRDQHADIDLVVVGNKEDLLEKVGAIVVLFNTQYVQETFNIIAEGGEEKYIKKYMIVRNADMLVLRLCDRAEKMEGTVTSVDTYYDIKILSKSNMICNQHQGRKLYKENLHVDMFFMAQAVIQKLNQKDSQEERWKTFVKFHGDNALYHPCLEDGICYKVRMPAATVCDMKMRKQYSNAWLQPLKPYFGTCECIYLPEESYIEGAVPGTKHLNESSVYQVLDSTFGECGPLSVKAVIKDRQHMTPKFPSEHKLSSAASSNRYHVGVPGNKIIRVLLCDCENPDEEIWLYLGSTSNYHIPQYSLGIIPGVTIIASCVLRNVSKQNKKIYLQSTVFTCLTPISKAAPDLSSFLPSIHNPKRRYLKDILGQPGLSFQTFATIGRICKVSFCCVCNFCNAEMVGSSCTYVGCHAQGSGKVVASAQVVIDDGTGTAMMFMSSVEHVKVLLQLKPHQYSLLSQEIVSGSHNLSYTSKFKDTDAGGMLHPSESGLTKAMGTICSSNQLLRPVNMVCRMFKHQMQKDGQDGDRIHLYCVAISEIKPNINCEELLKDVL
ncbi:CST complex subunit CTC1-like [Penaeus chinensis]|uniref:CST complex subunit CTC1-like n=1 Tax=Penaeus chinensis TaxID=139456 RepID=UPI001FB70CA3|nr:CST complex subunit CTC1-like [Penaeus chinensis]